MSSRNISIYEGKLRSMYVEMGATKAKNWDAKRLHKNIQKIPEWVQKAKEPKEGLELLKAILKGLQEGDTFYVIPDEPKQKKGEEMSKATKVKEEKKMKKSEAIRLAMKANPDSGPSEIVDKVKEGYGITVTVGLVSQIKSNDKKGKKEGKKRKLSQTTAYNKIVKNGNGNKSKGNGHMPFPLDDMHTIKALVEAHGLDSVVEAASLFD